MQLSFFKLTNSSRVQKYSWLEIPRHFCGTKNFGPSTSYSVRMITTLEKHATKVTAS